MTKEEKDYCEICGIHDSCAYVSRGMQNKCEKIQMFSDGFEAAIQKAIMWLETNYEDIGVRWTRGYDAKDFVEQFEKAMDQ